MPNWPGQGSRLVLYLFFSSRPSWHWHWLHGALLVSRVIYVPADTRWRWLKPFLAFCNSPASLPPSLPSSAACSPVPLVSLLIFLSVLIHGLRCLRRRNPNKSIFNAMRRTLLPVAVPPAPPAAHSLSGKCTVSVKGLSLISVQRQNSTVLRIILNRNLSLFITN